MPARAGGVPRCASCHAALPWVVTADDDNFADATTTRLAVLVDVWAPWCGPCRLIAPGVQRAAAELAGRLKVVKVNVDEAPGIAARLGVQGVPTLLVLRDGRLVARQVGAMPADRLVSWVRDAVEASAARVEA